MTQSSTTQSPSASPFITHHSSLCTSSRKRARAYVGVVIYLLVFAAVLALVSRLYLLPALAAAGEANPQERRQLAAHAWLVMAVVLFVLFAAMLLTVRIGRFFVPRPTVQRKKTEYVDAWAESGKRMKTPPAEDE